MTKPTARSVRRSAFMATALSLAVSLWAGLAPAPARAATMQSFQISPPTANYAADPGQTITGKIKVTNLTDAPISLRTGKQNFVAKGEEGEIELVDEASPKYSLAPWFTVNQAIVDVPAKATKEVSYTIAIPANAEPGGRYGTITFSTIPPKLPSGESGAVVQQTLAGIVFVRINGAATEDLEVLSFLSAPDFAEYGPVQLRTRIKNNGTVHEKPTGTITIKNMLGMQVANIPLDEHFVIPDAVRLLKNDWPTGKNKPFLIGRYTAHLDATYGSGKKLSADTSFVIFPWKAAIIVLIVLILLILFFWKGRKRLARAGRILAGKE